MNAAVAFIAPAISGAPLVGYLSFLDCVMLALIFSGPASCSVTQPRSKAWTLRTII